MASHWNTEYYDIMNFFYWEPQHLGKKKYPESKYQTKQAVMDHLKQMEVTLNHQFDFFFRLLPESMYLDFFRAIFPHLADDQFHYQSNDDIDKLELGDATQPDLFFVGKTSLLGIELKLDAKTTIDQVLKYAMLFHFEQKRSGVQRASHLVYFGRDRFSSLFKEKPADVEDLKNRLSVEHLPDRTKKGSVNLLGEKEEIIELARAMAIEFVSYEEVYARLADLKDRIDLAAVYHDAPMKLIDGMLDELEIRGLRRK